MVARKSQMVRQWLGSEGVRPDAAVSVTGVTSRQGLAAGLKHRVGQKAPGQAQLELGLKRSLLTKEALQLADEHPDVGRKGGD